jgi:hypothetical protein
MAFILTLVKLELSRPTDQLASLFYTTLGTPMKFPLDLSFGVSPTAYANHPRANVEYTIIGVNTALISAIKYLPSTNELEVYTNDNSLIGWHEV